MRGNGIVCIDDDPNPLKALARTLLSIVLLLAARIQANWISAVKRML